MADLSSSSQVNLLPSSSLVVEPGKMTAQKPSQHAAIDGRSLRATGRTQQLSTRVTEAFHRDLKLYAVQHRLKINELLELSFEALKRERAR
jgi:hypothetical protein